MYSLLVISIDSKRDESDPRRTATSCGKYLILHRKNGKLMCVKCKLNKCAIFRDPHQVLDNCN